MGFQSPVIPAPLIWTVAIAIFMHLFLMRSSLGVALRGVGGNAGAMRRFGWSVIRAKAILFGCSGVFGVCSGLTLLGLTTSADANIALRYTLLSVAGVILGGGEFVGGRVSPIGAVLGVSGAAAPLHRPRSKTLRLSASPASRASRSSH